MHETSDLSGIMARCQQVSNSPYMRTEPPAELKQLRSVLEKVHFLTVEDIPTLVAEIKRLRSQTKKLEAENTALRTRVAELEMDEDKKEALRPGA
jgi:hypothetical protein